MEIVFAPRYEEGRRKADIRRNGPRESLTSRYFSVLCSRFDSLGGWIPTVVSGLYVGLLEGLSLGTCYPRGFKPGVFSSSSLYLLAEPSTSRSTLNVEFDFECGIAVPVLDFGFATLELWLKCKACVSVFSSGALKTAFNVGFALSCRL